MRNHRTEQHRQTRGQHRHQRQIKLNTVTLTVEAQREILVRDCEAVLERDTVYQRNVVPLFRTARNGGDYQNTTLPDWNVSNLWRTLIMRALQRAGFGLALSRAMCLAYGFQPAS